MKSARGNLARTIVTKKSPNCSPDADIIFLKDWARRLTAKEGSRQSGMTAKGFQKLQQGENGISFKRLSQWMRSNPEFAADYAAHVGLILPGEAASAGAFTRAVNAYQQRRA